MGLLLKYMTLEDLVRNDDHIELFRQLVLLLTKVIPTYSNIKAQNELINQISVYCQKEQDGFIRKKDNAPALTLEYNLLLANELLENKTLYSKKNISRLVLVALGQNIPAEDYRKILQTIKNQDPTFPFNISEIIKQHKIFQEFKTLDYPLLGDNDHDNMLKARFLESKYRKNPEMLFFILQYTITRIRLYAPDELKNKFGGLISLKFVSLILGNKLSKQIKTFEAQIKGGKHYLEEKDLDRINNAGVINIQRSLFVETPNNREVINLLKASAHKLEKEWVKEMQQAYLSLPVSKEYKNALQDYQNRTGVNYNSACIRADQFMREELKVFLNDMVEEGSLAKDAIISFYDRNKDPVKMYKNKQNGKNTKDAFGARIICKEMATAYAVRKLVSERFLPGKENLRPDIFKDFHKKPKEIIIDKAISNKKKVYQDVLHCVYEKVLNIDKEALPIEIQFVGGEAIDDSNQRGPDTDYLTMYAHNYNKISLDDSFAYINIQDFGQFKRNGALIEKVEEGETLKEFVFRMLESYGKDLPKKLDVYIHTASGPKTITDLDCPIEPGWILEFKSITAVSESLQESYRRYKLSLATANIDSIRSRTININITKASPGTSKNYLTNLPGRFTYQDLLSLLKEKNILPNDFHILEKQADGRYKPVSRLNKPINSKDIRISNLESKFRIRALNTKNFKLKDRPRNEQFDPAEFELKEIEKEP